MTRIFDEQIVLDKIKQKNGDITSIYKPFLCCQQLTGARSYLSITFISQYINGDLSENYDENRNPRWVSINQVKKMISDYPENFFGISLISLKEYLKYRGVKS